MALHVIYLHACQSQYLEEAGLLQIRGYAGSHSKNVLENQKQNKLQPSYLEAL